MVLVTGGESWLFMMRSASLTAIPEGSSTDPASIALMCAKACAMSATDSPLRYAKSNAGTGPCVTGAWEVVPLCCSSSDDDPSWLGLGCTFGGIFVFFFAGPAVLGVLALGFFCGDLGEPCKDC